MGSPLLKLFDKVDACLNPLMAGWSLRILMNSDLMFGLCSWPQKTTVIFYVTIIRIHHKHPAKNVFILNKYLSVFFKYCICFVYWQAAVEQLSLFKNIYKKTKKDNAWHPTVCGGSRKMLSRIWNPSESHPECGLHRLIPPCLCDSLN